MDGFCDDLDVWLRYVRVKLRRACGHVSAFRLFHCSYGVVLSDLQFVFSTTLTSDRNVLKIFKCYLEVH